MLRKALEDYLDGIRRERDLDAPLLALFSAMGFHDVHFLHGVSEYGKDFIAKRFDRGALRQYVWQSKARDIGMPQWRDVKQQLLDAATSTLAHPGFDPSLPRSVILTTNGRLVGNAPIDMQDFRKYVERNLKAALIEVWDRERFLELFEHYGPERIHATSASRDYATYGQFFTCFGAALTGELTGRKVERHSESWLTSESTAVQRTMIAVLEAELLASACREHGLGYIGIYCLLCAFRAVALQLHGESPQSSERLVELANAILREVFVRSAEIIDKFQPEAAPDGAFLDSIKGSGLFVAYPVHCSRMLELFALRYSLADAEARQSVALRLERFVKSEPGAAHPISDSYAVPIVAACRVLVDSGLLNAARSLCERAAVWLGDRYQNGGAGLASVDADERAEFFQLAGERFTGTAVEREDSSFIATALIDLACFLRDEELYACIVHDVACCRIVPTYYQPQDTEGQFRVGGSDVVRFPNIVFAEAIVPFETLSHGEHLVGEPRSFTLQRILSPTAFLALSLVLRDRYFTTTWTSGIRSN